MTIDLIALKINIIMRSAPTAFLASAVCLIFLTKSK